MLGMGRELLLVALGETGEINLAMMKRLTQLIGGCDLSQPSAVKVVLAFVAWPQAIDQHPLTVLGLHWIVDTFATDHDVLLRQAFPSA